MNKKILILMISVFLMISFLGCTEPKPDNGNDNTGNGDNGDNGTPITEETIQEILAKGGQIDNIQYTIVPIANSNALPIEIDFYKKGKKLRMAMSFMGQESIFLFNGENYYGYYPSIDAYSEQIKDDQPLEDLSELSEQAITAPDLKELGKETVNGIKTRVIEFTYNNDGDEQKTKAWISEEYGIVVRLETESETGTSGIEIKDIKTGQVEDSLFEVDEDKIKTQEEIAELIAQQYQ